MLRMTLDGPQRRKPSSRVPTTTWLGKSRRAERDLLDRALTN